MILNANAHFVLSSLDKFSKKGRGWFETDIAKGAASSKSHFFVSVASQFDCTENVASELGILRMILRLQMDSMVF